MDNEEWAYKKKVREYIQVIENYKIHAQREIDNNQICHPDKVRHNSQRHLQLSKDRYKKLTGENYND